MTFRVGQKVVCVDDDSWVGQGCIVKGRVYEVAGLLTSRLPMYRGGTKVPAVLLAEFGPPHDFYAYRFRPIVERKTDLSIFTKMLTPSDERVEV